MIYYIILYYIILYIIYNMIYIIYIHTHEGLLGKDVVRKWDMMFYTVDNSHILYSR